MVCRMGGNSDGVADVHFAVPIRDRCNQCFDALMAGTQLVLNISPFCRSERADLAPDEKVIVRGVESFV